MNGEKIRVVAVTDLELLGELRRHGNNLNQLMHAIHAGFPVAPRRVEACIEALRALYAREIERG